MSEIERVSAIRAILRMPTLSQDRVEAMIEAVEITAPLADIANTLHGPKPGLDLSERVAQCEFDLEPAILAVVGAALVAGWRKNEIAIALGSLADHYLMVKANEALEAELNELLPNRNKPRGVV